MSRRLEIELTSERPDGTWTWRAAGAKQPKGELSSSVLPQGASVGDVLRVEADFAVDGIEIVAVLPPKAARKEPERLVITGTQKDEPLVTTQLVTKGGRGGGRRDRGDRWDRDDRGPGGGRGDRGPGGRGERGDRRGGPRSERDGERPRRERSDRPRGPRPDPVPERPKPKRLRPGRAHRSAVMDELAVEERPIAEQVLRGGVPAVREAIAKQNEQAKAENRPEVPTDQLVALAERLLPKLRAAEWRDKADAALADLEELDLRDLRSVVVAADGNTRDEESRTLLAQLQEGLARRVEQEQTNWIDDMTANLDAGRFVRALRLSSRPPKAGTPLPPELATRLIEAVSTGLTPTVNQDLWAAAIDALAFSPVRNKVTPAGRPEEPSQELLGAVMRVGDRLPAIVALFGLDPAEVAKAAKRRPRGVRPGGKPAGKPGGRHTGAKGGAAPADAPAPGDPAEPSDAAEGSDAAEAEAHTAPVDTAPADTAPADTAPASSIDAPADAAPQESTESAEAPEDASPAETVDSDAPADVVEPAAEDAAEPAAEPAAEDAAEPAAEVEDGAPAAAATGDEAPSEDPAE